MPRLNPDVTIGELGEIDPSMLANSVDTTATLSSWKEAELILADKQFVYLTMAGAYHAGVYSIFRQLEGRADALDLPVGACVGVPATETTPALFVPGFARDRDTGDRRKHAETNSLDNLRVIMEALGLEIPPGLTMSVTLESCPSCIDDIEESGLVSRLVHGATRPFVEELGLIKRHDETIVDIIPNGRTDGKYPFESFQLSNPAVIGACEELFYPFSRDKQTEVVQLDPGAARTGRFAGYYALMRELDFGDPNQPTFLTEGRETDDLLAAFTMSQTGFRRHFVPVIDQPDAE